MSAYRLGETRSEDQPVQAGGVPVTGADELPLARFFHLVT